MFINKESYNGNKKSFKVKNLRNSGYCNLQEIQDKLSSKLM